MNDRQRLEAIVAVVCKYLPPDGISREQAMNEIIGLIDPLPAQQEQEPVAWRTPKLSNLHGKYGYRDFNDPVIDISTGKPSLHNEPLYLTPPQRTWAGLTNDEIDAIYTGVRAVHHEINSDLFARAIEAKLKELNT